MLEDCTVCNMSLVTVVRRVGILRIILYSDKKRPSLLREGGAS